MKINEFIELMGTDKNKMLKADQLQTVVTKTIETKEYLSIKEKKNLVNNIVNECVLYEDGAYKFDEIDKYVCFTMRTIAAYTNLELSNDIEEDYDSLCRSKLLNMVIGTFEGEYENIKVLLQMRCDYILSSNNIDAQIGRFLNELLEKVDSLTTVVTNKIDEFSLDKLPINTQDIGQLLKLLNTNV